MLDPTREGVKCAAKYRYGYKKVSIHNDDSFTAKAYQYIQL